MSFGDSHTCHMEGICIVHIKLSDGMVRVEGCEVCTSVEEEYNFDWSLEAQGLRETLGEGVRKMFSGSLVVLKGIRRNLYYLNDSAVTENLTDSERLDGYFT